MNNSVKYSRQKWRNRDKIKTKSRYDQNDDCTEIIITTATLTKNIDGCKEYSNDTDNDDNNSIDDNTDIFSNNEYDDDTDNDDDNDNDDNTDIDGNNDDALFSSEGCASTRTLTRNCKEEEKEDKESKS